MSRDNTIKNVRNQHWFGLVKQYLDQEGLSDWEILSPIGRGHPKLVVRHKGKVFKTPVPSSERGKGDHKYLVNRIRKFLEDV